MKTLDPKIIAIFQGLVIRKDLVKTVEGNAIFPWSVSHEDHLTSGTALCRLCHWTFDEGLIGISPRYLVVPSEELRNDLNLPRHLMTLDRCPIIGPAD